MKNYDQILVLDFGSQYNQLIVRDGSLCYIGFS